MRFFLSQMHWRYSDLVAYLQFVIRLATFFIDAHLPLSDDAVDSRARHVVQSLEQEIVEPLIQLGGRNFDQADSGFLWFI